MEGTICYGCGRLRSEEYALQLPGGGVERFFVGKEVVRFTAEQARNTFTGTSTGTCTRAGTGTGTGTGTG